jgi:hypothetical protein
MQTITNTTGIPLPLAVWLLHDEYDYVDLPGYISVTSLMKPLRHIILPKRVPIDKRRTKDVSDFVSRRMGTALHTAVEQAWLVGKERALKLLGYPQEIIDRVLVNPTDEEVDATPGAIPVYLEQRVVRPFMGRSIGGKYDMVTEGIVNDTKSTTVYSWLLGDNDVDYQLQGSLYRWLDAYRVSQGAKPRITADYIRINFIFTDWQKREALANPAYPQSRTQSKDIRLLSLQETENWVKNKLLLVEKFDAQPEPNIPECTDKELWRTDPVYKYFSDPLKAKDPTARSSKNFNDLAEAHAHQIEKGKGVVITVPGDVKRCDYCPAFDACTQKLRYMK